MRSGLTQHQRRMLLIAETSRLTPVGPGMIHYWKTCESLAKRGFLDKSEKNVYVINDAGIAKLRSMESR